MVENKREIKFRAWEKNRKEMLEVLGIFFEVGTIQHKPLKVRRNTNPFNEGYPNTYFKDIELMQYTGLKDKNGKEIYEGDIVKRNGYPDFIYQVCWLNDTAMYLLWNHYPKINDWSGALPPQTKLEVIGNIYENPELLEAQ